VLRRSRISTPSVWQAGPPGCLTCNSKPPTFDPQIKACALRVLKEFYDDFTMRHFEEIAKKLASLSKSSSMCLKSSKRLNPKPGEGRFSPQENYVYAISVITHSDDEFLVSSRP